MTEKGVFSLASFTLTHKGMRAQRPPFGQPNYATEASPTLPDPHHMETESVWHATSSKVSSFASDSPFSRRVGLAWAPWPRMLTRTRNKLKAQAEGESGLPPSPSPSTFPRVLQRSRGHGSDIMWHIWIPPVDRATHGKELRQPNFNLADRFPHLFPLIQWRTQHPGSETWPAVPENLLKKNPFIFGHFWPLGQSDRPPPPTRVGVDKLVSLLLWNPETRPCSIV